MRKHYYETLGASEINSLLSPLYLRKLHLCVTCPLLLVYNVAVSTRQFPTNQITVLINRFFTIIFWRFFSDLYDRNCSFWVDKLDRSNDALKYNFHHNNLIIKWKISMLFLFQQRSSDMPWIVMECEITTTIDLNYGLKSLLTTSMEIW